MNTVIAIQLLVEVFVVLIFMEECKHPSPPDKSELKSIWEEDIFDHSFFPFFIDPLSTQPRPMRLDREFVLDEFEMLCMRRFVKSTSNVDPKTYTKKIPQRPKSLGD
jgi:hypothetical protein